MKRASQCTLGASLILLCAALSVHAYESPGAPTGFVNDYARALSEETRTDLEATLRNHKESTGTELAIAVVPTLDGDYIENFAVRLFEEWSIGSSETNAGILLLLAIEERELRIEVGYGLEELLTDAEADSIIRTEMVPRLRDNDYDGAVRDGVAKILTQVSDPAAALSESSPVPPTIDFNVIVYALSFGIVVLQWFGAVLARSMSWWAGGVIGAIIALGLATLFGWWLIGGVVALVVLSAIGLFLDYVISRSFKTAQSNHSTPPWWAGGSGGGGFSGSGGFRGFGGGRSGGGGASGRW